MPEYDRFSVTNSTSSWLDVEFRLVFDTRTVGSKKSFKKKSLRKFRMAVACAEEAIKKNLSGYAGIDFPSDVLSTSVDFSDGCRKAVADVRVSAPRGLAIAACCAIRKSLGGKAVEVPKPSNDWVSKSSGKSKKSSRRVYTKIVPELLVEETLD